MAYTLSFEKRVEKDLAALDPEAEKRIWAKVEQLAEDPFPTGAIKLKGEPSYRLRVGDYRILFDVDVATRTVTVLKIGHRKDIYR
ncbi:MAG: type II toxin-antitoxin system RelE/ParE family toxin [Truepera sp.]|nr:type II toxin-antitoxin system RelE/ParE family toxin [Truepera sp.]